MTESLPSISRRAARRYLALYHFLAPPRSLPAGPASVMTVVDRLGSVQFDPLGVAGRNHDLVLHARIAGYRSEMTDQLLYEDRLLFEVENKALCLVPTRELPWYRVAWDRSRAAHIAHLAAHQEIANRILDRIRTEGPLSSLDFERGPVIDWYWGPTSQIRAVLEALWESGVIGLSRRSGNRRFYDLTERLFPSGLLGRGQDEVDQLRHKLLSRYRGHGLLGSTGSAELWQGIRPRRLEDGSRAARPTRPQLLADLVEAGALRPVLVEGVRGTRFVPTTAVALLAQAERDVEPGPTEARDVHAALIGPLDPLVWDRALLTTLYDFEYTWEVYVPAARRRWGYYVLPIHAADRFVGRIEPRIDRTAGQVRILRTWWESGVDPLGDPDLLGAVAAALEAYRGFAEADRVRFGRDRAAVAMSRALRATGLVRV